MALLLSVVLLAAVKAQEAAIVGGAGAATEVLTRFEYRQLAMGVAARIVVYAPAEEPAREAAAAAFTEIQRLDAVLSDYRDDSELMALCARAGDGPVAISVGLHEVLAAAQDLAQRTGGAFDVTAGPLVRLWRGARAEGRPPAAEAIEAARTRVGFEKLRLREGAPPTAELLVAGMQLDVGALGKGYACDRALAALAARGLNRALVELGGDLVAGAPPPDAPGWSVEAGCGDGADGRRLLLAHAALATSGDSSQHLDHGGLRHSHVLDPRTGQALTSGACVTVVWRDGLHADAYATALSVLGPADGAALVAELRASGQVFIDAPGPGDSVSEPAGDGTVALFNGRDLSGWVNVNGAPDTWTVRDGMIVCSGRPTGVLRTEAMYENFELELEYRHLHAGGNAGLFIWSDALPARGQPFTRSVEVQVMDGVETDSYTSHGDVFAIHGARMTPDRPHPAGWERCLPSEKRARPAPEWNHYRVTCVDGRLTLAVNGAVVSGGSAITPRKGYLCLEAEGSEVHFRNLSLRELPASAAPLPPEQVATADAGFRALLTDAHLSGWREHAGHEGHWRMDDWLLDYDGQGETLWTTRDFGDFELIADWRWSGPASEQQRPVILPSGDTARDEQGRERTMAVQDAGDSGLYLRGSSKAQVNIWCWPIGSGEVYGYRTDPAQPPEVRAAVTPRTVADAALGEWNRFHVTLRGDRLTVVLNGQTVIEEAWLPGVPERGPIALQHHGAPIQFANLYLRELE